MALGLKIVVFRSAKVAQRSRKGFDFFVAYASSLRSSDLASWKHTPRNFRGAKGDYRR
jgi:hypothetical protein